MRSRLQVWCLSLLAMGYAGQALSATVTATDVLAPGASSFINQRALSQTISFAPADFGSDVLEVKEFSIAFSFTKADAFSGNSGYIAVNDDVSPMFFPGLDEIALEIASPGGTIGVVLVQDRGASGGSSFDAGLNPSYFRGTVIFDQDPGNQAVNAPLGTSAIPASAIADPANPPAPAGDPAPTGLSYNRASNVGGPNLDDFLGINPVGAWTYTVSDVNDGGVNAGGISLYSVSISITTEAAPSVVPVPGTAMLLIGAMFAGGMFSRRRRR